MDHRHMDNGHIFQIWSIRLNKMIRLQWQWNQSRRAEIPYPRASAIGVIEKTKYFRAISDHILTFRFIQKCWVDNYLFVFVYKRRTRHNCNKLSTFNKDGNQNLHLNCTKIFFIRQLVARTTIWYSRLGYD